MRANTTHEMVGRTVFVPSEKMNVVILAVAEDAGGYFVEWPSGNAGWILMDDCIGA